MSHNGETVCARLGPFGFDNLIMQEVGGKIYIYIYHISKHSLSQVYNMHTRKIKAM